MNDVSMTLCHHFQICVVLNSVSSLYRELRAKICLSDFWSELLGRFISPFFLVSFICPIFLCGFMSDLFVCQIVSCKLDSRHPYDACGCRSENCRGWSKVRRMVVQTLMTVVSKNLTVLIGRNKTTV